MEIKWKVKDPILIMKVIGEIDLTTASRLKSEIDEMLNAHPQSNILLVLLDMVSFIDSSGLGAILGAYKRLEEDSSKIFLVAPKNPVRHVLDISGVSKLVTIFDTMEEALSKTREGLL